MTTKVVVDKAGRVVIPKGLRDELQLSPGDSLELESHGEQITLRPVRGTGPIQKEDGVWVFRTGIKLSASVTNQVLEEQRNSREVTNLGKLR